MRILYIITQGEMGGAQKYVLDLATHFNDSIIACGTENQELLKQAEERHVPTEKLFHLKRAIYPFHDLLAIWEIIRLIKKTRPDILHLNSSKAGFLGSIAGFISRTPTIYTAHGFVFNEPLSSLTKLLWRWIEKCGSFFRTKIICVSEADKQSALQHKVAKPEKLTVIHNGIKAISFIPKNIAQETLKIPAHKTILGTIAHHYTTKGIDTLIEAVKLLPPDIQEEFQCVLIGNGPLTEHYQSLVQTYHLQNTITFLGNVPDASTYLKALDIFILPSRKEGFPYAILEAMQAGLPIITTEVGGIKEAIENAGILIPPENPTALADAIKMLIRDPAKRNTLANAALARSAHFTLEKLLTETQKVYTSTAR